MMRKSNTILLFLIVLFLSPTLAQKLTSDKALCAKAQKLAQEFIIVDTHIDLPYRLKTHWEDISRRTPEGNFDFVRAKQGGLNAAFMAVFVPSEYESRGGSKALADSLIDLMESFPKLWPKQCAVARSASDVTRQFKQGKFSLCLGIENGSPIEHDLSNVRYFYNRGIRYITLAHGRHNHISDSSYDSVRVWKGLSFFGQRLIEEMNRIGMMVDVSHITDDAFYQVISISKAPVIASHSSCRAFIPGFERNMSDDMIKLLAQNGGLIMIAFGSDFLNADYQKRGDEAWKEITTYLEANNLKYSDPKAREYVKQYRKDHPVMPIDVSEVANHIDHVVKLVGVDFVGFGSDFEGVGDSLPTGLEDVSGYPNIIYELLKRGYSDKDIQKICGGNLLRVWSLVEQRAKELQKSALTGS